MSSDLPPVSLLRKAATRDGLCVIETAERLFGHDVAEIILRELAGQRFYVATQQADSSVLSRLIGRDKAAMISAEIGGVVFFIPTNIGLRHRRVIRLSKAGASVAEIVKKTGYGNRHVFRLLRDAREAGHLPPARPKGSRR